MNWQDFLIPGFVFQGVIVSDGILHFSGSLPGARWTPLLEPTIMILVRHTHTLYKNNGTELQEEMKNKNQINYTVWLHQ